MPNIVESKNYTYFELKSAMHTLAEIYPFVSVNSVGKSVLGKELLTLSVGKGNERPEAVQELLEAATPRTARVETAPARGLFLWKVFY